MQIPELEIKVFEMDEVIRTPDLLSIVRELTISPGSGMNQALNEFEIRIHERSINAKAIIGYHGAKAVGWALHSRDACTDEYRYNGNDGSVCFQVFVCYNLRRQGIGSKLFKKASEIAGSDLIRVYHSDAPEFFRMHKIAGLNVESIYKGHTLL